MKAEIRRLVGLLPLMLLSLALLSLLVRGSGVLAYRSFQSPTSPPPPTVPPSPTATAIPPTETPTPTPTEAPAPTETPTPTPTETLAPGETPTPTPTETLAPGETPIPSPTPTFEAAPPAAVASPIPSAEETPSHPSRSWADYIEIGLVALVYTWRALGVLALIAFLGLVIFLGLGRWRS
ncbi:MAG: hypothetical protein ACE5II_00975 [Anaerolineae bacterium]